MARKAVRQSKPRTAERAKAAPVVSSPVATIEEACAFIGGARPIHYATYWRGVKNGVYPAPVAIGPGVKRVPWKQLHALMRSRGAGA